MNISGIYPIKEIIPTAIPVIVIGNLPPIGYKDSS